MEMVYFATKCAREFEFASQSLQGSSICEKAWVSTSHVLRI
jgi:hypothetical protein